MTPFHEKMTNYHRLIIILIKTDFFVCTDCGGFNGMNNVNSTNECSNGAHSNCHGSNNTLNCNNNNKMHSNSNQYIVYS